MAQISKGRIGMMLVLVGVRDMALSIKLSQIDLCNELETNCVIHCCFFYQ